MAESFPNDFKTLWAKEKLLVTSNFSFSHSVFKRLVSQGRQKVSLCGNGLILVNYFADHKDMWGFVSVKSIFSFFKNVFNRPPRQGREKQDLFGTGLTLSHMTKFWA